MVDKDLVSQIKTALEKEPGVVAAYIIGSVVTGTANNESDFDLAVVVRSRKIINEDNIYELIRGINFPRDLDLSVVDKTSSPIFLYQIVSKGDKIYEKNSLETVEFESFALRNYYDTAHTRNIYHQALKERFYAG